MIVPDIAAPIFLMFGLLDSESSNASLLNNFEIKVITVYIQQEKEVLLRNLLNKPLNLDEKVNRIMALEAEQKNADICDYTVPVTTYANAAKEILKGLFHTTPAGKA